MAARARTVHITLILVVAFAAGCEWLPARRRLEPSLSASSLSTSTTSEAAEEAMPGGPLPPLPVLQPISDQEALATSSPTPLLDAALVRAETLRRATLEGTLDGATPAELDEPEPQDDSSRETQVIPESAEAAPESPIRNVVEIVAPPDLSPEDEWRTGLLELLALARRHVAAESATWEGRELVLTWLAHDPASPETSTLWRTVLTLLATPVDEAALAESDVEGDPGPFRVSELQLCRKVVGFGAYEQLDPSSCRASQPIILYCELEGVGYEPTGDDQFRSRVISIVAILPEQGETPLWSQDLGRAEDLSRRRRRDYFVNYRLTLPDHLTPGRYRLRLSEEDLVTGRTSERILPIAFVP